MTLKVLAEALALLLHVENESRRRGGGVIDSGQAGPHGLPAAREDGRDDP